MEPETHEEFIKKVQKVERNSNKLLQKLLVFFKKIENTSQFDDYLKDKIAIPFFEWFLEVLIRAFLIFFCLTASGIFLKTDPQLNIALAAGISLSWFLLVQLKQDLWRKEK